MSLTITVQDTPENRAVLLDVAEVIEYDLAPQAESDEEAQAYDALARTIRDVLDRV